MFHLATEGLDEASTILIECRFGSTSFSQKTFVCQSFGRHTEVRTTVDQINGSQLNGSNGKMTKFLRPKDVAPFVLLGSASFMRLSFCCLKASVFELVDLMERNQP
jgi:hypothetical protein